MAKRNHVSINVDKEFFEKFFEPERKRISKLNNYNFSQLGFTRYLKKSGAKLVIPKRSNIFAPKKKRYGGFSFTL